jgi:hypothetical protein
MLGRPHDLPERAEILRHTNRGVPVVRHPADTSDASAMGRIDTIISISRSSAPCRAGQHSYSRPTQMISGLALILVMAWPALADARNGLAIFLPLIAIWGAAHAAAFLPSQVRRPARPRPGHWQADHRDGLRPQHHHRRGLQRCCARGDDALRRASEMAHSSATDHVALHHQPTRRPVGASRRSIRILLRRRHRGGGGRGIGYGLARPDRDLPR